MLPVSKYEKYTFCTVFNGLKMTFNIVMQVSIIKSTSRASYKVKKASISFIVEI